MKWTFVLCWSLFFALLLVATYVESSDEMLEESDSEVVYRVTRGVRGSSRRGPSSSSSSRGRPSPSPKWPSPSPKWPSPSPSPSPKWPSPRPLPYPTQPSYPGGNYPKYPTPRPPPYPTQPSYPGGNYPKYPTPRPPPYPTQPSYPGKPRPPAYTPQPPYNPYWPGGGQRAPTPIVNPKYIPPPPPAYTPPRIDPSIGRTWNNPVGNMWGRPPQFNPGYPGYGQPPMMPFQPGATNVFKSHGKKKSKFPMIMPIPIPIGRPRMGFFGSHYPLYHRRPKGFDFSDESDEDIWFVEGQPIPLLRSELHEALQSNITLGDNHTWDLDLDFDHVDLGPNGTECRYKKGPWEQCDTATNTQKRNLTLKRGQQGCEQSKVLTRNCKKGVGNPACRYEKGQWGDCDAASNTRTRTDTLKPSSDASCDSTRKITKKCKNLCRYDRGASWSQCDSVSGQKTKIMRLIGGSQAECEPTKTVTKPCGAGGRKGGRNRANDDDEDDEE